MLRTNLLSVLMVAIIAGPMVGQAPLNGTLPACGSVGDLPVKEAFTIELHKNGMLSVKGLPLTFDECFDNLATLAKSLPGENIGPIQASRVNVVIRADQTVPLAAIDRMLRECVRRDIAAPRIFFGATHSGDNSEGAFAYFLPIDRGTNNPQMEMITVVAKRGKKGDIAGLHKYLLRLVATIEPKLRKSAAITIRTQGDITWQAALGMIDAAARAGIPAAYLECQLTKAQEQAWTAPTTRRNLRALLAAAKTTTKIGCELGPLIVRSGDAAAPPARTRGAFAGYTSSPNGVEVEEIEFREEVAEAEVMVEETTTEETVTEEAVVEESVDQVGGSKTKLGGGRAGHYGNRGTFPKHSRPGMSQAIDDGLTWLKQHQDDDGKWDCDGFMKHDKRGAAGSGPGNAIHDVGVTGLALLAMLADGSTMRQGPYRDQVRKAVHWLRSQQQPNGMIGGNQSHDFIYDHAIATHALVEAYGLSSYKTLRPVAQKALDYLEAHRNPGSVWRYQPQDGNNDTSVTNWCAMAYLGGRYFDLQVNTKAFDCIADWLDKIADPVSGHHGYSKRGEPSSRHAGDHIQRFPLGKNETLTGSSLLVRYLLGQTDEKQPILQKAANLIASKPPAWEPKTGNIDLYAWHWCSMAMYQTGGRHWRSWSADLTKALLGGQSKNGAAKGSWDPIGVWGEDGGRVASTALATLSLQSFYRYARLLR